MKIIKGSNNLAAPDGTKTFCKTFIPSKITNINTETNIIIKTDLVIERSKTFLPLMVMPRLISNQRCVCFVFFFRGKVCNTIPVAFYQIFSTFTFHIHMRKLFYYS